MDGAIENGSGTNPAGAKVDELAQKAHQATDKIADLATAQVGRLSDSAHRAVNGAADAAASTAAWVTSAPTDLTAAVSDSIRARPIATVAGALFVGYLLGRLAS